MRGIVTVLALVASIVLLPAAARAQVEQNSITGVARDASGGVLPGVTVEVASPALIEKVRNNRHRWYRPVPDRRICSPAPTR